MRRWIKWLAGLGLLPLDAAATVAVVELLRQLGVPTDPRWGAAGWSLPAGFLLWLAIYFLLPRPVWSYVLAHELTHALWGALMGARIGRVRVSRAGGSVQLSESNFLVALAPYFFPLYTILVILLYALLALFFEMRPYEPVWLGLVGLTWGFHLTFTLATLKQRQPDILQHGRLFSYALIYLFNVLGIGLWIGLTTSLGPERVAQQLLRSSRQTLAVCGQAAEEGWRAAQPWWAAARRR